ncbi:major facilitator superfamily domain-containing protein [Mycena vulgaris]|nr:major facilitator superfamily domain-containing protein [Mycena vulgaris]
MAESSAVEPPTGTAPELLNPAQQEELADEQPPRDIRFWLIFVSLCVCGFIVALELGSISTALLTIVDELHGEQFIWVGSAYALAATALVPLSGGLAQVFGRRPILLGSLLLFAAGSTLCGAAKNMNVLIAGRTIQGLGGGGIISLTQIVVADLVSLRERGAFNGLISISWSVGCGIGPVVGGSLAVSGQWRWLFYLNVPICGVAAVLVILFLRLQTPAGTLREKLARIDYTGNLLVVASTTSTVIALTWGGIQFAWGSVNILVPLILGMLGVCAFMVFERRFAKHPMVPFDVLSTRTGLSGYAQNFFTSLIMITLIYYLEVYFQACYNVSPIGAGVDGLGLAFVSAPMGLVAGIVIQRTNSYRVSIWFGWICMIVGVGLLSTLDADTSRAKPIGYSIIAGAGIGILFVASYFPVLAPLHVSKNAQALSFFVWGITIGGTILQNELHKHLPAEFIAKFPGGTEIAYSIIPVICSLEEPLRRIAGFGFLVSLLMKHYQLHTAVDRDWGIEKMEGSDSEKDA